MKLSMLVGTPPQLGVCDRERKKEKVCDLR